MACSFRKERQFKRIWFGCFKAYTQSPALPAGLTLSVNVLWGMLSSKVLDQFLGWCKPGALHPVTTATIQAQTCFRLSGLWPKIQATRYAGGR